MKKEIVMTGRNVEEAVALACEELGVSRDSVEVEVIELQKKSFFGLKVTPAKVKVTFEQTKGDLAAEYVGEILEAMGVKAEITVENTDDGALIKLEGDALGVIIGRRGETLDALQYLASLVANRSEGDYFRITIDSGNFREKREVTLKNLASKIASQAIRTGRSVTLEPMNPYERRIIHATVSEFEGVSSKSVGEDPNRKVVVMSDNPRRSGGRGNGRNNRGGRGGNYRGRERRDYDNRPESGEKSGEPAQKINDEEYFKLLDKNGSYGKIEL